MSLGGLACAPRAPATFTEAEFRAMRDFVYARSGLTFGESRRFLLESRVAKRLRALGLERVSSYLEVVCSPARGGAELLALLDEVTTHETSFFRNRPQLEAFRRLALPGLLEARRRRGERSLRVWSAGCSSGEEPYTLAMLLLEALGDEARRWGLEVVATDVSQSMLARAVAGEYGPYSFRTAPAYFVQRYFDAPAPRVFRVRPEVRQLVEFHLLNFADRDRMQAMTGFQVVFCRNALIYFDAPAKRRVVDHFFAALEDGGYLFLGHSESLYGVTDAFTAVTFPGALAYVKPGTPEPGPEP